MRYSITVFLSLVLNLSNQAQPCVLPLSFEKLNPDKCGIRYVQSHPDHVDIILEFEKKARIKRSSSQRSTGVLVNLQGVYKLQYNLSGYLLWEERYYVNHPKFPDDVVAYELDGYNKVVENKFDYISEEVYDSLPWNTSNNIAHKKKKDPLPLPEVFFDGRVNYLPTNQLASIEIFKHSLINPEDTSYIQKKLSIDLLQYDEPNKKQYWVQALPETTDPKVGKTVFMLSKVDRKAEDLVFDNNFRVLCLDSVGRSEQSNEIIHPKPMEVVFHHVIHKHHNKFSEVEKIIFMLREKQVASEINPSPDLNTVFYYIMDRHGAFLSKGSFKTRPEAPPFNPIYIEEMPDGLLFISEFGYQLESSYLSFSGVYQTENTGSSFQNLALYKDKFSEKRFSFFPSIETTYLGDGSLLYVYEVLEDIGLGNQRKHFVVDGRYPTSICHGIAILQLTPKGKILTATFYARPPESDPQAKLEILSLVENDQGCTSFFVNEQLSSGSYPILFTLQDQSVSILKNEKAFPASEYIYYDSEKPIISYFGITSDPDQPANIVRTVEVIRRDD